MRAYIHGGFEQFAQNRDWTGLGIHQYTVPHGCFCNGQNPISGQSINTGHVEIVTRYFNLPPSDCEHRERHELENNKSRIPTKKLSLRDIPHLWSNRRNEAQCICTPSLHTVSHASAITACLSWLVIAVGCVLRLGGVARRHLSGRARCCLSRGACI